MPYSKVQKDRTSSLPLLQDETRWSLTGLTKAEGRQGANYRTSSAPQPINGSASHTPDNGSSHQGICFSWLVRLLMGQEDVQHCLPAWLCQGAGIVLSSTILPGFLARCDLHPRAPVSMLRGGIKEAS